MNPSTHLSLLNALKDTQKRKAAWLRFHDLYQKTIQGWCARWGLQQADADDVTQTVLMRLIQVLPEHQHDPTQSFRGWLKTVVNNALRDVGRAERRRPADRGVGGSIFQDQLAQLESPDSLEDLAGAMKKTPWMDPTLAVARERVQARVGKPTWQAFWRMVMDERPAQEVAAELGMSVGSVFKAKYRVARLLAVEYSA